MGDATQAKAASLIQSLDRRYGKVEKPVVVPPPASADAAAVASVSAKNAQTFAGVVLGLHGPPAEGAEAAKKLMGYFVDWNEVRVSRPMTLVTVLGRQPRGQQRIQLLQRFLESYFLRQRSLNLDYLYTLKTNEAKRFLQELEVFDREELAAVYLTGFNVPVFPPSDMLRDVAENVGLIKPKVTTLQMAKKFETSLNEDLLYSLYSHLYSLAYDADALKQYGKKKKK
ncbi:MAG TPA: hypothetical protein VEJ63_12770 [Planctomycetota bacterium]|nr:hypothetical protein [Planctomycetota bacterium]